MRSPRVLAATTLIAVVALGGCASGPTVDLDEAKAWADDIVAAESDGPGAAGTGLMSVGPGDDGSIRFDFDTDTALVRIDVRCFGDDDGDVVATVTAAVTSSDGATVGTDGEIPCDREAHEITVDGADATAIEIRATATAETYLHATVIQELVIERE
ncbi:hypothetical protein [Microbacterium dauci]|uniref:Lipoprotein n=1 Tax=Microbacterium dauci TaxID=3048008 RepID=A0ABT6Z9S3_9MICO|nr:hypothetical protein [Microbacterium sp. LX3-4]MDJ1112911.1 hypothetical protein [Microbacterium sp. LX3-4]